MSKAALDIAIIPNFNSRSDRPWTVSASKCPTEEIVHPETQRLTTVTDYNLAYHVVEELKEILTESVRGNTQVICNGINYDANFQTFYVLFGIVYKHRRDLDVIKLKNHELYSRLEHLQLVRQSMSVREMSDNGFDWYFIPYSRIVEEFHSLQYLGDAS